ncbi:DNA cytosine methyltransferase [Spirosoma aerophilum]
MPTFYEFFAGGGMAKAGLGEEWQCLFANDFDEVKGAVYNINWGAADLVVDDIANITTQQLPINFREGVPRPVDLAWASSPCQDLSLAGSGNGLGQREAETMTRSGTFWHFCRLIEGLVEEGHSPRLIVLENVTGAITSHQGKDFTAIISAFVGLGYRVGAVVMDAQSFLPQSRKRLFVIGVRQDLIIPEVTTVSNPTSLWHPKALTGAYAALPVELRMNWIWWNMPQPPQRGQNFIDIIEENPSGVIWHTQAETNRVLELMNEVNLKKVHQAQKAGRPMVGGVYRRMRPEAFGKKVQRAEVRFDDVSGCLRTPSGGSSRQVILLVDGDHIRSRLLSPREGARLMGLPDNYVLPTRYNDAYHLTGDGVVVPVVRYLAHNIFEPILEVNDVPPVQIPVEIMNENNLLVA